MNRKELIELAAEAGMHGGNYLHSENDARVLERFARLVAQRERDFVLALCKLETITIRDIERNVMGREQ